MKAPFTCPNSSLSSSVSGRAAQLTLTKAASARGLSAWIARAASSLPVPLSPAISTVEEVRATVRIMSKTERIAADVPLCAAIGSGFVRKGFDLLLTLWRRSPPARAVLLLVGDDERLLQWRRQVDDPAFAGRVLVTGPRSDVEAVLAAADVVCVPSRQEAFGNVVLEACAAGVPVVTSRRTGAAELLDGDLARLVIDDAESLDALAAALEEALGSDRGRFGAEGRRLAEALPWDLHLDHVEALLEETARGR